MAYGRVKLWLERDEYGQLPEITEAKHKRLSEKAFNYCCWSLGNSAKSTQQLVEKMRQKNCPEDIITATIAKLSSYGYLDDQDFANSFRDSKRYAGWGARRIRMELQRKGVDPDIIDAALHEDDADSEMTRAREFAIKKMRSIPASLEPRKKRDRLVRAMSSRGFDMGSAFQIVNELMDSEDSEDD